MNIVLFEDSSVERLYPITLSRPAYTITCGAWRLLDVAKCIAAKQQATLVGRVRGYLDDSQLDFFNPSLIAPDAPTLWLNARLVPNPELLVLALRLLSETEPYFVQRDGEICIAFTKGDHGWRIPSVAALQQQQVAEYVPAEQCRVLDFPHTVLQEHLNQQASFDAVLAEYEYDEIQPGVYVGEGCELHASTVLDTTAGPIILDAGSRVGPFAVITGPVRIGRCTVISPHALLKGPVSIGDHCKVGGEVGKSIIESYSNKVHYGYLGTSYVGRWVNLGAGTTNSNLKNTYGTVRMDYESGKTETGMQFLGCVIGDLSKTAIQTSIFTGKLIGVCSNVYGTVTKNVPSFANYARSLGEVTEHPADVMHVTQKRVFERRGIQQLPRHRELIQAMYDIEAPKRKLANKPPTL